MWRQIRNQCDLLPKEKKMGHQIPCGLDDSRLWDQADTAAEIHSKQVEDYADNLLDECKTFKGAERINRLYDLFDGDTFVHMIVAVANSTGSTDSRCDQMKKLENLLADAMQEVAELEVKS